MKRCLLNMIYPQSEEAPSLATHSGFRGRLARTLLSGEEGCGGHISATKSGDHLGRMEGRIWPMVAHTMIGLKRLDNLQFCVDEAITNGVRGDLIETGVWRGGAAIFMRAMLKAYGVTDRCVWVADSFEGLPPPNTGKYPHDANSQLHESRELAVSLEEVQANFERYGLLDGQVRFLKGWFCDTLPAAPIERLAVLRLDGDMYQSTMDALVSLYPKVSQGGYVIVDDYGCIPACRQAVHDYRSANNITDEIRDIDWTGIFWQKGN
ncbi:MAG: macrocin O-methyltransferase [Verrucomicrobia bacterium]|nr:MAG: macrocin O-methyltransferase [Verrucomicrobiota bacterium]PYJ35109.1 MAG: macrocin O-methyltransferase [Verrucomicrobiota bacterium]